jgi:hypothetical protein
MKTDTPIIVFSFDRPSYLDRFCASLKTQAGVHADPANIHLFQDAAVSRRSGVAYAKPEDIAASIEVFRAHFPTATVHTAEHNLGIAFNIARGEAFAFETLNAEFAYFFEDDLELGPDYLFAMEQLRTLAVEFPQIGYFAAYGDHRLGKTGNRVSLVKLDHHWGFGLRKSAWAKIRDWMAPFYEIMAKDDYRHRNHLGIFETYLPRQVAFNVSSQDSIKTVACADLGIARVMTDLCFGRYIGEHGASFSPEKFAQLGYDKMQAAAHKDYVFEPVTARQIAAFADDEREKFTRFREREFEPFLVGYRARVFNPERLATAEDVEAAYRVLLDRNADPGALEFNVGKRTVRQFRTALMRSNECRGKSN